LEEILVKHSVINGFEVRHQFPLIGEKTMLLHARAITQKVLRKQLIILVIEDITEHRITQQIAKERELWFKNMADNAPAMIWMTGQDKTRNFFNKTWYQFTGLQENEETKTQWQKLIHPEDVANFIDSFDSGFDLRRPVMIEYRLKRADNQYRWITDIAKPYYSNDGYFLGYIGTSTELHDKRILMDELESSVKERTRELKTINNELTRSNNELQQFAYVASHDLQEPLRKILTYIDRIQHHTEKLPGATEGYFEKIIDSARRMTKLIDDLLDFSTISFSEKKFTKVDLNTIVKEILHDLDLAISERNAVVTVDEKFPVIEGEAIQLSQLFHNLIANALKFAREGESPVVTITHRMLTETEISNNKNLEGSGPYVEIKFIDNGIGFSSEFAEQIFVIFQRLNEKKKYPGTGIGLALCRRIVNNHRGQIFAQPQKNGAVFYVILPLRQPKSYGH
jgi:two-component system, chemotaxis family, CheB/CheR fusion protein